jgi:two-component system, NarL family, sensor histidine kinase DevS
MPRPGGHRAERSAPVPASSVAEVQQSEPEDAEDADQVRELDLKRQVAELTRELEVTNTGVIALLGELDRAREGEARLAAIVRSSDDAIYSIDLNHTVRSWNPGAKRVFGYSEEEIVGKPVELLMPDADREAFQDAVKRLVEGEQHVHPYDSWRRRKDGSLVECSVTLSAVRGPDGRLLSFSVVGRDITDRRRAEQELAAARAAAEILEERDRIARDLHDLVIQRLFADGMSLQSVITMPVSPDAAKRIEAVADDLDTTIRQLRSTIFALQRPSELVSSLRARLLEIAGSAASSLGFEPKLYFEGTIDASVPDDVAEHMTAVLREALSNVARHAQATKVEVRVVASRDLVLSISDNGRGIGETSRRSGLSNMAERAELLGGKLIVASEPGTGTMLEWTVPLVSE